MPIKHLAQQRQGKQIGEIRTGQVIKPEKGRARPSKLDTFRLTTKSPLVAQRAAEAFGGTATEVDLQNNDRTFEVVTATAELQVMVPPGDAVISQWMEMWGGRVCQRRCDGEVEQLTQSPCKCPADTDERMRQAAAGLACKPTTRLNVILPDLPDLGVWKLESHGFYAAIELGGTAELLSAARNSGVTIPAVLRLVQRQVTRIVDGSPQTMKFGVPRLEVGATLRELVQLDAGTPLAAALPPPPPPLAIGAGPAPQSPTRAADAPTSAQEVADRAKTATTRQGLVDLGKVGRANDWLAEMVESSPEVFEPLGDVLMGRLEALDHDGGEPA